MWIIQGDNILAELPDEACCVVWLTDRGYGYDMSKRQWYNADGYVDIATVLEGDCL